MDPVKMDIPGSDPDTHEGHNVANKMEKEDFSKKKLIYELGADATLEFSNEETIHINKTVLSLQSKYFFCAFFGSKPATKIKINDFDRKTFKIFLDCLFGLEKISVSNALMIFPIAHRYNVEKCLKKCTNALKPRVMNDEVLLSLNLAVLFESETLVKDIVSFLKLRIGMDNVLENKDHRRLLEPRTMRKFVVDVLSFDSYVWNLIYLWGKEYLETRSLEKDIHTFFAENNILQKLSLSQFESVQSIFDFHKLTEKKLMNPDDIVEFLCENSKKTSEEKLPEKSDWMNVKKGETIKETVVFKNSLVVSSDDWRNKIELKIVRNCARSKTLASGIISCKVRLHYRNITNTNAGKSQIFKTSEVQSITIENSNSLQDGSNSTNEPPFHLIHEIEGIFRGRNNYSLVVPIKLPYRFSEVKSLEIFYTFECDRRILKTSISENFMDADKLYFTQDVFYSKSS